MLRESGFQMISADGVWIDNNWGVRWGVPSNDDFWLFKRVFLGFRFIIVEDFDDHFEYYTTSFNHYG